MTIFWSIPFETRPYILLRLDQGFQAIFRVPQMPRDWLVSLKADAARWRLKSDDRCTCPSDQGDSRGIAKKLWTSSDTLHGKTFLSECKWGFPIHGGTPKSSICKWIFHYKPSSYWGTPIYGNPHLISETLAFDLLFLGSDSMVAGGLVQNNDMLAH